MKGFNFFNVFKDLNLGVEDSGKKIKIFFILTFFEYLNTGG